jgi:hypothetical protein
VRLQFYETTVLDDDATPALSFQILSTPAWFEGVGFDSEYAQLLEEADRLIPIRSVRGVTLALLALQDEDLDWEGLPPDSAAPDDSHFVFEDFPGYPEEADFGRLAKELRFSEYVAYARVLPIESSPLDKHAVAELLVTGGTTASLAIFAGVPMIVLLGVNTGLVVIQGVIRPVLRGAEKELEEFGSDTAAVLLDAIRRRLGIPRKGSGPP